MKKEIKYITWAEMKSMPVELVIKAQNHNSALRKVETVEKRIAELNEVIAKNTKKIKGYIAEIATQPQYNLTWEEMTVQMNRHECESEMNSAKVELETLQASLKEWKARLAEIKFEETVDVKNYVEDDGSNDAPDEEDDNDELIDEAEVITVEEKVIATADLEKKLAAVQAEIKTYKATLTESETDLDTQQKAIMEYASKIYLAKHNAEKLRLAIMMQESMIEECEEEAAALETEILNRKITESYIDSIVTAEAFNASIQAEEMAAAIERGDKKFTFPADK